MKSPIKAALAAVCLTAAIIAPARAVQLEVSLQGFLTNATGTPITTAQTADFKVLQGANPSVAGSGTLVYEETGNVAPKASGVFTYLLGSGTPATAPLTPSDFDTPQPTFVQITIGGTVVLPMLQLTGMPYAAIAGIADSLRPTTIVVIASGTVTGLFTAAGGADISTMTVYGGSANVPSITTAWGITAGGPISSPLFIGKFAGDLSQISGPVNFTSVTVRSNGISPLDISANANPGFEIDVNNDVGLFTYTPHAHFSIEPNANGTSRIGAMYSGPATGYSGLGQETSRNSLEFGGWSTTANNTLGAKIVGINKTAFPSSPWYLAQTGELHFYILEAEAQTPDDTVDVLDLTSQGLMSVNGFSTPSGVTAATLNVTGGGGSTPSVTISSGLTAGGPITAPYINAQVSPSNVAAGPLNPTTTVGATSITGTLPASLFPSSGVPGMAPVGSMLPYAGTSEPAGWVECDGRSVPQTGTASASWGSYNPAALFAALGTVWGSSAPGQFNVPDMRGIFPRGWNHGKSGANYADPDASSRVAQYTSGATGDAVGSYQMDQFRSHVHQAAGYQSITAGGGVGAFTNSAVGAQPSTTAAGGDETRPMNASVMYIIRAQ